MFFFFMIMMCWCWNLKKIYFYKNIMHYIIKHINVSFGCYHGIEKTYYEDKKIFDWSDRDIDIKTNPSLKQF